MNKTISNSTIMLIAFLAISMSGIAQENEALFSRLSGIKNNGYEFFNVDGHEISFLKVPGTFSKKSIRRKFKKLQIKEEDLKHTDSSLAFPNYISHRKDKINDSLWTYSSSYFIQKNKTTITAITFNSFYKKNQEFQVNFVSLILANQLPASIYQSPTADSVNFGGRMLYFGNYCRWMGINNLQCPGNGQMNWSIYESQELADEAIAIQKSISESKNNGKVVKEEEIDLLFEELSCKATKTIFDFSGATGIAVGMSGGKTLSIYYISAPVRGNYLSCVLSFWNNDNIQESGLTPLLEEVIKLK